ncbi:MAG TPA: hypothetical protein PK385_08410 [Spirochaetota bacterium]|nr:hypothetical protein [Spirochaetota bacterium]HOS31669.1 hypothetical protein [Spirochaetota bacterium]HOS56066.1 hypothetical protein [Spirochaetota bacterium]HPK61859.1 hypothetical protein [Spirochaetota bacterium]HQF77221.1 hypothetical protein [Spirochaetota bacterium]
MNSVIIKFRKKISAINIANMTIKNINNLITNKTDGGIYKKTVKPVIIDNKELKKKFHLLLKKIFLSGKYLIKL